ncbi:MAG: helix-turn-helix domain-containing protein [Lachnospiraceae bacterium]|nr:helix-turn-helix domain-containing protein [Lachnospiraceae bacterium]
MQIWERIFENIKKQGLTQKEFSQRSGIAESTISDWRRKNINPGSDKIPVICSVLNISPEELLGIPTDRAINVDLSLSDKEQLLIEKYRNLDDSLRERLMTYLTELSPAARQDGPDASDRSLSVHNEYKAGAVSTGSKEADSFSTESERDFQIRKDLVKRLRKLARLSRIRLDESEHALGLNLHLYKYLDYLGIDKLEFVKGYLCQLQPFMISEINSQEKWDNAICVLDEYYRISVYIKVDATKGEELIVSFHENNKNGIAKRNFPIRHDEMVYVFEDSVGSHVTGTETYTINLFIMRGVKSFPINVPAARYDEEGFLVRYSYINNALIDICNRYLEDLYTSDLDISYIELFSSLQQLSFSSYGNDVFSNISLLIDSILVQKNDVGKQVADAALCIYCNNTKLTDKRRAELLETLKLRFAVNSIRILPQILERVESTLSCM